MSQHRPEVADVFRQHGQEFLQRWGHTLNWQQIKALRDIGACQTWKPGVHVRQCERWGPLFLPAYGVASLVAWARGKRPYLDNRFEREAYDAAP